MKPLAPRGRQLALLALGLALLALLAYVGLRSGPLAPVAVTAVTVQSRALTPALFGVGTVEARYTYKIGPTFAGRVGRLDVQVGDRVQARQVLGEMEPVDLDDRVRALESASKRAQAALREAEARQAYAQSQALRYERLAALHMISEEVFAARRQELQIADAALAAAREDIVRTRADRDGLAAQKNNLRLVAPVDGVVVERDADPGTTVVAGQAVVEVIDPASVWLNVRFDQVSAAGLAGGLPVRIVLRSRGGQTFAGRVLRVEPKADPVTEETLAKVAFERRPEPLPPLGELVEVTVDLPALPAAPLIPNAAVRREGGRVGVWQIVDGGLRFIPLTLGAADLNGDVQVRTGLASGERIVRYSERALTAHSRISVVERIAGVSP
ncbi:MAG TPA: efflux RND transporter periplasmic adaptor subunit [Burkholderiaceae bacterium]|jgi:HlyD family secretion protein|nr:efflux RND transporter periplasmic adaptor subunit [Burkholderiaceae bacterium]